MKDKEFVKRYGKTTTFTYGCPPGAHEIYVYRMSTTNEDGNEIDYSWDKVKHRCAEMDVKHVPELKRIIYSDGMKDVFLKLCEKYNTGESTLTPTHIREGIVVRADGSKWTAWKNKSFEFKVIEGINKETGVVDPEEAQGV